MRISRLRNQPALVVALLALFAALSGVAVAGSGKIGTKDIENRAVTGKKVEKHALKSVHINGEKPLKCKVLVDDACDGEPGPQGPKGDTGPQGPTGPAGADGTAEPVGVHWNANSRNNIGSPRVVLQAGPYGSFGVVGPAAEPPYGVGSLGIGVNDVAGKVEKANFGNEVDFFGDAVTDIDEIGFHVFQTGENAGISPTNMPIITFEVDPNLDGVGSTYSSLTFIPDAAPVVNMWSGYIDGTVTGGWYFTNGASATATGCSLATPCDWDDLQAALEADDVIDGDPTSIYTFGVGKGRDSQWFGAIDGLRLNGTVYDFEPFGVKEVSP